MDAPPIQYCRTDDGVNIAYTDSAARLPPLVVCRGFSHLAIRDGVYLHGDRLNVLEDQFRLIRYDHRGFGESAQDGIEDFGLETRVADLRAVFDACALESAFLLTGEGFANLTAIPFAATHPGRVDAMVLTMPYATAQDLRRNAETATFLKVRKADPRAAFEHLAIVSGYTDVGEIAAFVDYHTVCLQDRDVARAWRKATAAADMTGMLGRVTCPVLVIPGVGSSPALIDSRPVVAGIPNAQMTPWRLPSMSKESDAIWQQAIRDFFGGIEGGTAEPARASTFPPTQPSSSAARLSPRELEVLRLIAAGKSNPQIAEALVIAPGTVGRHVSNMLAKTGLKNRVELATYATEHGLRS